MSRYFLTSSTYLTERRFVRIKPPSLLVPQPDTPDLFTRLPPELRNAVYEFAFCNVQPNQPIHINDKAAENCYRKHIGLFRASRQIRSEALSVYYGTNAFMIHINGFTGAQFQQAAKWLRRVIGICGVKHFASCKFRIHGSVWEDPAAIMPLLKLMRETGFWPYTAADELQYSKALQSQDRSRLVDAAHCSMFVMQTQDCVRVQSMLEELASLARRAHLAALGPEMLRLKVEAYVRERTKCGWGRAAVRQRERRRAAREKTATDERKLEEQSLAE